jgi:hypothetical protein
VLCVYGKEKGKNGQAALEAKRQTHRSDYSKIETERAKGTFGRS